LWFVFGAVGDDDAASGGGRFFHAADQDAVMQWAEFSHGLQLLSKVVLEGDGTKPIKCWVWAGC
jgi:hypothetical protein